MIQDGDTEWLSTDPPLIAFTVHDRAFAAPRSYGCGPLGRLADRRFGLPSAAGENEISLVARYTFKFYDELQAATR
ncbi:MAG TPA: hypothetical protein DEQ61_18170 [Streptomyces sp.]|nr:hypothetical protein [Streptomyces sp.]